MIGFVLTGIVVTFTTWALADIYFYSVYFERIRACGRSLAEMDCCWKRTLGYGLNCRYCLSHWIAACLLFAVLIFPTCFGENLTLLEAVFLAAITSRLALVLHDNILRPLTYSDESGEEPNEPGRAGSQ